MKNVGWFHIDLLNREHENIADFKGHGDVLVCQTKTKTLKTCSSEVFLSSFFEKKNVLMFQFHYYDLNSQSMSPETVFSGLIDKDHTNLHSLHVLSAYLLAVTR